ncbi:MAG: T9SS type A sorting domain-containing protein [Lewinellaceae bacterium]|nr:T9SS type A sorting domain-containing protein [Lewinellaceae bacterium]MCB9290176.1 T9SS type A sorting domain-containing protein [Lewinellaceae bacterium]
MKRLILLAATVFLILPASAQLLRARVHEDLTITVEEVEAEMPVEWRGGNNFEQLPGFPKAMPANPTFKNIRNITLADLDDDGVDDILWGADNKLLAYSRGSLLWERTLSAVAIYPPSAGDIDGDGQLEIVLATGGLQASPRLYAFEKDGADVAGWPLNLNNNWVLVAPTLSDLDGDGAMEIVVSERDYPIGYVHIIKGDGTSFSPHWPVALDATPAVTPSISDIDGDGKKDIVIHSYTSRYIFGLDGQPKPGFPIVTGPAQIHSYQSPILARLGNENQLQIVGASHGDSPEFYIIDATGAYRPGWPIPVPGNNRTFSTPTVVKINGEDWIFMGRNQGDVSGNMLFAWDADGNLREGFPINKTGGNEGIISIGDIDGDGEFELVFGSDLYTTDGPGFIHAYELDGSGEVEGFPLRPRGANPLNGAALSDINGDNLMDLVAISFTVGTNPDSVYLNAYNLNVPYSPERVLWSTYKGSSTRDGTTVPELPSGTAIFHNSVQELKAFPNPATEETVLYFTPDRPVTLSIHLTDAHGRARQLLPARQWPAGEQQARLPLNNLPSGLYWISVRSDEKIIGNTPLFIR